jgi:hypothetical protein
MNRFVIIIVLAVMPFCKSTKVCEARLLTHDEMYDRASKAIFHPKDTPYYLESGQPIPKDSLINFDRNKFALSEIVDCRDSIVKLIIRPIKSEDLVLRKKIDSLYSNHIELAIKRIKYIENDPTKQQQMIDQIHFNSKPILIDVDCDSIFLLINNAFVRDQNNRTNINLAIDKDNIDLIESIISKCGYKSIEAGGEDAVYKSFMIIQHGPAKVRKKYLQRFKDSCLKGLLNKSTLALMIDRTLVDSGKEQLYGTQYKVNKNTGDVEFYPIQEIRNLDLRRREMGMSSFEIYKNQILEKEKKM